MNRDPSRPIRLVDHRIHVSECGYALDFDGGVACRQPSAYRFRMKDWPEWRTAATCPEHALIVRRWDGIEWMRSLAGAS